MNKNNSSGNLLIKKIPINHFLLIMRTTIFLLFTCVFCSMAELSYTQNARVTINKRNATIKEILNEIEKQTDYLFIYNDEINANEKVSVKAKQEAVSSVLNSMLKDKDMKYSMEGNHIILSKSEPSENENITNVLQQQKKRISGTVLDENGQPIIGANIIEAGTTNGTVTDIDGKFTLDVSNNATIRISYIGYLEQEVNTSGKNTLNITLVEDTQTLEEVVVVGYGIEKKVNIIGSIATVGTDDLNASPVSNISNAIAGRLPGVVIQQATGEPGNDAATIRIRGRATLGDSEPLVVVDGIPGRDLNSINVYDVENISVLKDASAAIYGARAANGVILITTKQGKEDAPLTVNYGFYQGFSSPTVKIKMADAPTYAQMIREVQTYQNVDEANMKFSLDDIEKFKSGEYPWTHPNTDWYDAALKNYSTTWNHNVSINGGSKAADYYISFGTHYDGGLFKNSSTSFTRNNIKATVNAEINKYLSLGLDINGSQENKKNPSVSAWGNFEGIIKSLPTSPAFFPNGLPGPDIAYGGNPVVTSTDQTGFDNSKRYRANTMFSANLKIPGIEGLVLSSYYAYDLNIGQRKLFQKPWMLYELDEPAYLAAGNTGKEDGSAFLIGTEKGTTDIWLRNYYDDAKTKTFNVKADYKTTINDVHNISAFIAYESSEYESKGIDAYRRNLISDQLPYLFAGGDAEKDNSEFITIDSRINYFGRLSYNYKETYLMQFAFRRDGSLRFSKDAGRWGNFPSVLGGWIISNEEFWKNHVPFIDFFKLKASWGKLGNDLIEPFQYLPSYSFSTGAVLGSDKIYSLGLSQTVEANPNVTWEVANMYNAGFEAMLLNHKLTLNTDFFYQRRKNILIKRNASVPQYTGIQLPDENYGVVDNRGFEVELGYANKIKDFSYSVNTNFAFARNKVKEFDEPAKNVPWQELTGHPMGTQLLYKANGIFRDVEQINNTPHVSGARPGDIIIEDINKDGEITNDDRIRFPKTTNPEITYGISFDLQYKNWGLNGLIQGAGESMRRMYFQLQGMAGNYFEYDAIGRWTPDRIDAKKPRAFDRNDAYWRSDYMTNYSYQSTEYARMKNLELSYILPKYLQQKLKLNNAQIYLSGQNLFLIYSKNKITDPELGGNNDLMGEYDSNAALHPLMKVFAIGARISF